MIPSPEIKILSLKEYFEIIYKRLWIVILCLLLLVAFFVVYYTSPRDYSTKATIILESSLLQLMDPKKDPLLSNRSTKDENNAEMSLLQSDFLAERVIQKLDFPLTLEGFRYMTEVNTVFRTNMIEVQVTGKDPEQIADIANLWIREYIHLHMEKRVGTAKYGSSRLEDQSEETLNNLRDTRKELAAFLRENGDPIMWGKSFDALTEDQQKLKVELIENSLMYKEKHPKIIALKKKLDEVESLIEIRSKNVEDYQEVLIEYGRLVNKVRSFENIYEELLERSENLDTALGLAMANVRVIEPAKPPKYPVDIPQKTKLLLFVGALFSGCFICFVLEYFDASFKRPEEVEFFLKIPFLGDIPYFKGKTGEVSLGHKVKYNFYSDKADVFRALKVSLDFSMEVKGKIHSCVVSSSLPKEGKTFIAFNLAAILGAGQEKILIIDADMNGKGLSKQFNVLKEKGLSNVLNEELLSGEAILKTGIDKVYLLPSGYSVDDPIELLSSTKGAELLSELKENFDKVIIDAPCVTVSPEVMIISPMCDGVILAIEKGKTHSRTIKKVLSKLRGLQVHIIGGVFNAHREDQSQIKKIAKYLRHKGRRVKTNLKIDPKIKTGLNKKSKIKRA